MLNKKAHVLQLMRGVRMETMEHILLTLARLMYSYMTTLTFYQYSQQGMTLLKMHQKYWLHQQQKMYFQSGLQLLTRREVWRISLPKDLH